MEQHFQEHRLGLHRRPAGKGYSRRHRSWSAARLHPKVSPGGAAAGCSPVRLLAGSRSASAIRSRRRPVGCFVACALQTGRSIHHREHCQKKHGCLQPSCAGREGNRAAVRDRRGPQTSRKGQLHAAFTRHQHLSCNCSKLLQSSWLISSIWLQGPQDILQNRKGLQKTHVAPPRLPLLPSWLRPAQEGSSLKPAWQITTQELSSLYCCCLQT